MADAAKFEAEAQRLCGLSGCGLCRNGVREHCKAQARIGEALQQAHAAGRRAGLGEAAHVADENARACREINVTTLHGLEMWQQRADEGRDIAAEIRALIEKEPTT